MVFRRLPRFIDEPQALAGNVIRFPGEHVDLHPNDTVVFGDGTRRTLNSVDHGPAGTVAVIGPSPHGKPRPIKVKPHPTEAELDTITAEQVAILKMDKNGDQESQED